MSGVLEPGQTGGRLQQAAVYTATAGAVMAALLVFIWPLSVWTLALAFALGWGISLLPLSLVWSFYGRWFCAFALIITGLGIWQQQRMDRPGLIGTDTYAALGTLTKVEPRGEAYRLLFSAQLPEGAVPVRLTHDRPLQVGGLYQIGFWATPVSGPLYPGGFDPAFKFAVDGIYGFGRLNRAWAIDPGGGDGAGFGGIDQLRLTIAERVMDALPDQRGAVVTALLTGHRGSLSQETRDLFRDAGLAHLLAISGLHLSLVGGLFFALVRGVFWLWPRLSLQVDQRRWATLAALGAVMAYFLLSGGSVPTQRALVLTLVAGIALLLGRRALSWRLWALALLTVILISPAQVYSLSTHLSFLAVGILIRTSEILRAWQRSQEERGQQRLGGLRQATVGLLLSTGAVNILTIPLLLLVFAQAPLFGLLANLVAVPLAAFALLPLALLSLILMPFGFEGVPLGVLGFCLDALFSLAEWVTSFEANKLQIPKSPLPLILPLMLAYGLILMPVRKWRRTVPLGGALLTAVTLLPLMLPKPLALHHPEGWVLHPIEGGGFINSGVEDISAYDFNQVQGLWYPNQSPHEDLITLDKDDQLPSLATPESGPILIYEIRGRRLTVSNQGLYLSPVSQ